jgi:hypothetical protein
VPTARARIARSHDKGPFRILGDLEPGLALRQFDLAHVPGEMHLQFSVGIDRHHRAVAQRHAANFAQLRDIGLAPRHHEA